MVRLAIITCESCEEEFEFDFDGDEFREYGGAECPHCGYDHEDMDPTDYLDNGEPKRVPRIPLEYYRCQECEEIFGARAEYNGELTCPYCGIMYR